LAPLLATNDLLIVPRVVGHERSEYTTKKDATMFRVVVTVRYELVSLVDGSSLPDVPFVGEGTDQGDKATSKALSMSFKYFAIQTFSIPVEGQDDADSDSPDDAAPKSERRTPVRPVATAAAPTGPARPTRTNRAYLDNPEVPFTELTVEQLMVYRSWLDERLQGRLTATPIANVQNHVRAVEAELTRRLDHEATMADQALAEADHEDFVAAE
jgi:hypothetical protein